MENDKEEIRHDILFQIKKNAYIHKYKEPFILKNIDDAMEILGKIVTNRKSGVKKKVYCEFIDNKTGKYVGSKRRADFHPYGGAICVTEKEVYEAQVDLRVLAPAVVDVLGALWWSITNNKEDIRDSEGKAMSDGS